MDKVYSVCGKCADKHCCRGLCKDMHDYLMKKKENKDNKQFEKGR